MLQIVACRSVQGRTSIVLWRRAASIRCFGLTYQSDLSMCLLADGSDEKGYLSLCFRRMAGSFLSLL